MELLDKAQEIREDRDNQRREEAYPSQYEGDSMLAGNVLIDKLVRQILGRTQAISKNEVITRRYEGEMENRKNLLAAAKIVYPHALTEQIALKEKVIKSIRGESNFSQELLSGMIADGKRKIRLPHMRVESAQAEYERG